MNQPIKGLKISKISLIKNMGISLYPKLDIPQSIEYKAYLVG
jgi:hypothetical protein